MKKNGTHGPSGRNAIEWIIISWKLYSPYYSDLRQERV